MAGRGTPHRAFRVPEELYRAALAEAERRGESLSDAVRQFLADYAAGGDGSRDGSRAPREEE